MPEAAFLNMRGYQCLAVRCEFDGGDPARLRRSGQLSFAGLELEQPDLAVIAGAGQQAAGRGECNGMDGIRVLLEPVQGLQ